MVTTPTKPLQPLHTLPTNSVFDQLSREAEEKIEKYIGEHYVMSHPESVKKRANELAKDGKELETPSGQSTMYMALSLFEYRTGALLSSVLPERFQTYAVRFSLQLQQEYSCTQPSEMATAHTIALHHARILFLQHRISMLIDQPMTKLDIKCFSILSVELDRAERAYRETLELLAHLKKPAISLTVKTNQANFAHQMVNQHT
jgi:hypothetical protein